MSAMKIDLHTHILPERWPDWSQRFGYPGFVRMERADPGGQAASPCRARLFIGDQPFREVEENCWCPRRRVADCREHGVSIQVLSTVPVMFSYWAKPADGLEVSRFLNDHLAGVVAEHPQHFQGLGTLPMQEPDLAVRELDRCMRRREAGGLGLAGVQIGSHVNDWNLGDPELYPVFQQAEQLGAAVFVHPWDMMGRQRMPRYWLPWLVGMPAETSLAICSMIFAGVFERLPKLRVAFAHGGGAFPGTIGRIEHGFRVRPDLVAVDNPINPRAYLARQDGNGGMLPARFYVDSLTHDAGALRLLLKLFGPQRVALGSDYPFPLGEHRPGALIESLDDVPAEAKEWLLARTAREFLRITP
jgi:aminocarboxymuconate-semialdehyde decarboxylase